MWTNVLDVHGLVQFSPAKSRHGHRQHRRRLPQRTQVDAAARSDLRRDSAQARPWQDEVPQDRQRQQGTRLYRQQGRQTGLHRS